MTAKHHSLQTDASFRFERGADPNITVYALKRTAMLIKEIAGGETSSEIVDVYPTPIPNKVVNICIENVCNIIGKELDTDTIRNILVNLEFDILEENENEIKLSVPKYRYDVVSEVDVIEEILRIYGYNNVEIGEKLNASISYTKKPDPEKVQNTIADMLSSEGFSEIMTNSLTKSEYAKKIAGFEPANNVVLFNPLSSDLDVMRQSLLFGGLESIVYNLNRKSLDLRFYEFGYSYRKEPANETPNDPLKKFQEKKLLALFITGKQKQENWNLSDAKVDFYTLKSYADQVLSRIGLSISDISIKEEPAPYFRYGLNYNFNGKKIAELGMVHQEALNHFDIKQPLFYGEIDWQLLLKSIPEKINFFEIPKYPEVRRDLALLINKDIRFEQIESIILKSDKHIIKHVGLFDVYEGDKIEEGKKSYAVKIIFQDKKKTLTDKQVDKVVNNIIRNLGKELSAEIR
jgi:phenylalanyl-tRNA synthetase beta chain